MISQPVHTVAHIRPAHVLSSSFAAALILQILFLPGCADNPATLEDGTEGTTVNTNASIGDSCGAGFGRFCDGNHLFYCSASGKVKAENCSQTGTTCVSFKSAPGYAACIPDADPSCSNHGETWTVCTTDENYHDEMSITMSCAKGSNGKYYEIVKEKTFCSTLCSKGCQSRSCTGSSASCDGDTLLYCHEGQRYAVNCKAMKTTCIDEDEADCETWPD